MKAANVFRRTEGVHSEAIGPNDVWAMDFVHNQLATQVRRYDRRAHLFTLYARARSALQLSR